MENSTPYLGAPGDQDQWVFDHDINLNANFDDPAWAKDPILFPYDSDAYPFVDFSINTQFPITFDSDMGLSPEAGDPQGLLALAALEPSSSSNADNTPLFSSLDPGSARTDELQSPDFGNLDSYDFGGAFIDTSIPYADPNCFSQLKAQDGLSRLYDTNQIPTSGNEPIDGSESWARHESALGDASLDLPRSPSDTRHCHICRKDFATKEQFTLHMQRHDLNFICPVQDCGSRLGAKKELHRHCWTHHRDYAIANDLPEREEPCHRCGKSFRKDNLKRHLERARPCKPKRH